MLDKRIVFGIKIDSEGILSHEFYIYNDSPDFEILDVRDFIYQFNFDKSILDLPVLIQDHFMYSFSFQEIDNFIKSIDFYRLADGYNYRFDGVVLERRNHYTFFKKCDFQNIFQLLLFYTNKNPFASSILLRYMSCLEDSGKVCIAKKKNGVGIYLNRLNMKGFRIFLKEFGYFKYPYIISFFSDPSLNNINIDCSIDFEISDGIMKISKTGFYAVI